jgi:hypothetical protein
MRGGGVRLWGDVGEVWRDDQKVGIIYRWELQGWERDWRLEAERYRLEVAENGPRNVSLVLDAKVGVLHAVGAIWTDFTADGASHRAMVIKGGALRFERAVPAKGIHD